MINMMNGDCMEFMASLPDNAYELAIVDPPYGIFMGGGADWGTNTRVNHAKKGWDNHIPDKKYFIEIQRVSNNQIIWGGNYFLDYLANTKCMLVWDKMNGTNPMADCEIAWASFDKPVRMFKRHIFSGIGNTNYTTIHPTQKPVALYKWLLKNYAKPGDKILDTHGGSGSICIACHDMGFDLDWIELDEDYYSAAIKRFNTHTAQGSLFEFVAGEVKA